MYTNPHFCTSLILGSFFFVYIFGDKMKSYALHLILILVIFLSNCSYLPAGKKKTNDSMNQFLLLAGLNQSPGFNWNLPAGFPIPSVPPENPISEAKVTLGRFLFYDKNLSNNQTQSCSSCHLQSIAFSDGRSVGLGSTGEFHPRNPQALSNVAYMSVLTWANSNMKTLELQSRAPLFGISPIELGLTNDSYLDRFRNNSNYTKLFYDAFGGGLESINEQNIRFALASFQRTLISGNSAYDKYTYQNNKTAMSASAIRGMNIFNGETAECFHCHGGFNFADSTTHSFQSTNEIIYNDNGFKSLTEYNTLNDNQKGFYELSKNSSDIGKFRAPSLRNVAYTYPYMHDGSINCTNPPEAGIYSETCAREALEKVVDHYSSGGKTPSNKDSTLIKGFSLTTQEKTDLVNFLLSLSDESFITNKNFSNPNP